MGRRVLVRAIYTNLDAGRPFAARFGSASAHVTLEDAVRCASRTPTGVSRAPPTGQVAMSFHVLRAGALLALVASSALLDHSVADARRVDSTVVVGRVTSSGRAVQGVTISVAGRATSTISASDGRYALTVERAGRRDRVTLLARRVGYAPVQRAVDLAGDTVRVDISLVPTTPM